MRFYTLFTTCLFIGFLIIVSSYNLIGQSNHTKKAKPNFMLSASYGDTYRDVLDPSQSYSKDLYKYTNRTTSKSYWLAELSVRQPVYKTLNVIISAEYSNVYENVSEGFVLLLPESMDKRKVFNSNLSSISSSIKIGETYKMKRFNTQVAFGPVFTLHSMYVGNTLSEEWTIQPISQEPNTNVISSWDLSLSLEFEVAKEIDLSVGMLGRLGSQMMSLDDGLYRNYNAAMVKAGIVYYPGRHNSTIHTIERVVPEIEIIIPANQTGKG